MKASRTYAVNDAWWWQVFYGDRGTRDKFNVVLAEMINPKMAANLYLDGKEHESEIKQVLSSSAFVKNIS